MTDYKNLFLSSVFILYTSCGGTPHNKKNIIPPKMVEDSICKYGKKYLRPERTSIDFHPVNVSDSYKINEIRKALPDSHEGYWRYDYFFKAELLDYDPKGDSLFIPKGDQLAYKLKDTYFADFNGDGKLDFIHYPKFYRKTFLDYDSYEIFIKRDFGYKILPFLGYITNISFNNDGTLNEVHTFQEQCCDDNHCFFNSYVFSKSSNSLILKNTNVIITCQLK